MNFKSAKRKVCRTFEKKKVYLCFIQLKNVLLKCAKPACVCAKLVTRN